MLERIDPLFYPQGSDQTDQEFTIEDRLRVLNSYSSGIILWGVAFIAMGIGTAFIETEWADVLLAFCGLAIIFEGYGLKKKNIMAYWLFTLFLRLTSCSWPAGKWAKRTLANVQEKNLRELMTW